MMEVRCQSGASKRPQAKEFSQLLEAERQEKIFPIEPLK